MAADRPRYGPLVAAIGAAALGIAVFLPWYGLAFTQSGVESAQQVISGAASQYGNATLQGEAGALSARFGSLAGRQLGTVSAHDVLRDLRVVLLVIAAAGLLAALLGLAGAARTARGQIALLGTLAAACVAFRMVDPPVPDGGVVTLSLQWGAWLALLGALAMIAGDLWPAGRGAGASPPEVARALEGLSGWTPQA